MNEVGGITQKTMGLMANVANSTISRLITAKSISPLPCGSGKSKFRYSVEDTREITGQFVSNRFHVEKKIHCFYNFKGGVGKTSICFQVASHLAMMGFEVLAIDADPQGHLSTSFGFDSNDRFYTLHDAITGVKKIEEVIHNVYKGLDCIPSNLSLTRVEVALNDMPKREERIRLLLNSISDKYDFIIFDTNPTISYLNRNVITCCDVINLIVEAQAYSLNGVRLVLSDIHSFVESMMIKMPDILMFPNKYEDRTATSNEAMSVLNKHYTGYLKQDFAIRKSEDFNIASKLSKPLAFFCRNNSIAFEDILDVINHILSKTCIRKE